MSKIDYPAWLHLHYWVASHKLASEILGFPDSFLITVFSIWHILILVTPKMSPISWRVRGPLFAAFIAQFWNLSHDIQWRQLVFGHFVSWVWYSLKQVVLFSIWSEISSFMFIHLFTCVNRTKDNLYVHFRGYITWLPKLFLLIPAFFFTTSSQFTHLQTITWFFPWLF